MFAYFKAYAGTCCVCLSTSVCILFCLSFLLSSLRSSLTLPLTLTLSPSLPLPPLSSLLLQVSPEFPEESWSFPKNYQSLVKGNLAGMAAVDQARAAETVKNDY